jgi:uridylate kinase
MQGCMSCVERILIKITGNSFKSPKTGELSPDLIVSLAHQCKQLVSLNSCVVAIVVGGGNFFRGGYYGPLLKLNPAISHDVGMLATVMNGLIIRDIFEQAGVSTILFSGLSIPSITEPLTTFNVEDALQKQKVIIFSGGIGSPFFTTDTAALIYGLRIRATSIWKATNVDGVYDRDPAHYHDASFLKMLSYDQAISMNIGVMDKAALVIAQQYQIPLRVFNIFTENALLKAYSDKQFGSSITTIGD